MGVRLTYSAALLLHALARGYRYGFDVMDATGLPSGTVYPALRRMQRAGLVTSEWEDEDLARQDQRPARRYYCLTAAGRATLARVTERFPLLSRSLPAARGVPR